MESACVVVEECLERSIEANGTAKCTEKMGCNHHFLCLNYTGAKPMGAGSNISNHLNCFSNLGVWSTLRDVYLNVFSRGCIVFPCIFYV